MKIKNLQIMRSKLNVLVLLIILCITNAYLLSHPNLVGKLGVLVYKHNYIKTFPKAILTVFLTVGAIIGICILLQKLAKPPMARMAYVILMSLTLIWLIVINKKFSSFGYSITGKAFIYGVYLLPITVLGIIGYYFLKCFVSKGTFNEKLSN